MTPDEYQKLALRTEHTPGFIADTHDIPQTKANARLLHGMIGVCTEAGELQDMMKRHLIYGKDFDPTNVIEECGDLLWYIALCLDATGYTMADCMERNIGKLRARYPQGFAEMRALNRNESDERKALEKETT